MNWLQLSLLFFAVLAVAFLSTYAVLRILRKRSVLDHPNERSSHQTPTPRGGGLAVVATVVPVWTLIGLTSSENTTQVWTLSGCALALAAISWRDDLSGLPPIWRLLGQAIAVALVLAVTPGHDLYFAGLLPPFLDVLAAGLLWVWFINLFNFMDGIDGIAGMEAFFIGIGVVLIASLANLDGPFLPYGLTIAAASLGFLWWNWRPARIFLGDVGSVPLGFLLGWLLLTLSAHNQWAAALILPLYYLADASVTLIRRAFRGKKIWRAHREHFYQQAVQKGQSHSAVVRLILMANLALLTLAALATMGWIWQAVFGACVVVLALLFFLGPHKKI